MKIFVLALLIIGSVFASATAESCTPGVSFKKDCNSCRCPANGLVESAPCTKMSCKDSMFSLNGSLRERRFDIIRRAKRQADGAEATCVPGTSFKYFCNSCTCGSDGLVESAACTRKGCAPGTWNEDGSRKSPSTVIGIGKRQVDGTCVPGTSFKKFCNTCTCGPDGSVESMVCTEMGCVPGMWNEDGSLKQPLSDPIPREKRQADGAEATCVPGKGFKHYCNQCSCPPSGLRKDAGCTLMGCAPDTWNEDGSLKQPLSDPVPREKRQADETCEPGTNFKLFCNNCLCPDNGSKKSAACTAMACPDNVWNKDGTLKQSEIPIRMGKRQVDGTCVPGTSFKKYCNTCTCGPDGSVESMVCTRMECVPGMWNEDGSLKQPLSDPIPREKRQVDEAHIACAPGTSFQKFCNTCNCGPDGFIATAACTRKECVPGMWNEDGTLKQPLSDPAACAPGTSFQKFCNTCNCGPDGLTETAACTRKECIAGMWNKDGTLTHPLSDPIPREKRQADGIQATCVPGTTFMQSCNTCTCGPDGSVASAACTLMLCPSEV